MIERPTTAWPRIDLWTCLIVLSGVLVAVDSAGSHSPTHDETLHVVSGLAYWEYGRWDVYPQNPPLVKLCLAAPLLMTPVRLQPDWFDSKPQVEFRLGVYFHSRYRDDFGPLYFRCRIVSILFYAWGAWLIGRWAGELFGLVGKRGSVALWCFHPLVLAHASVATPDLGAAVIALAALRSLNHLLKTPSWWSAIMLGVWLGAAQASKFTLIVLYPIFAVVAALYLVLEAHSRLEISRRLGPVCAAFILSLLPLGGAYCFDGLGCPLEGLRFDSPTMQAVQRDFGGTLLAWPARLVSRHYWHGIDMQATDVDGRWINYLNGHESKAGWLVYYPLALALKTPVAFWVVVAAAVWAGRCKRRNVADEAGLLCLPLLLFSFLWLNTTLTYMRYLLPCYPPAFVWLGRAFADSNRRVRAVANAALVVTILASFCQHPHYLGYFQRMAGGPADCWRVFSEGEVDWGQDLPALADWQRRHPAATPMHLALFTSYAPPYHGLSSDSSPPQFVDGRLDAASQVPEQPSIGYFAIGVSLLNRGTATRDFDHGRFANSQQFLNWLRDRPPEALVGTSILVFRFSPTDVEDWQRRHSL